MYSKKSIGPRTEPCGTPDVTSVMSDRAPLTETRWLRFDRKDVIQLCVLPVIPCGKTTSASWEPSHWSFAPKYGNNYHFKTTCFSSTTSASFISLALVVGYICICMALLFFLEIAHTHTRAHAHTNTRTHVHTLHN